MAPYFDFTPVITSAGVPDPFVPVDGDWNVTGDITLTGDLSGDNLVATSDVSAGGSITGSALLVSTDAIIQGALTASSIELTSPLSMDDITVNSLTASSGIGVSTNNVVDVGEDALRVRNIYASGTLDMADGNIWVSTGSAANPSIAFSSDTDNGLYLAAADSLGVSFDLDAQGSITGSGGFLASAPSVLTDATVNALTASNAVFTRLTASAGGGILSNGDVDVNSSITGSGILCDTLNAGVSTATDLTVNTLTASAGGGILSNGDVDVNSSITGSGGFLASAPSVLTDLTINTLTASAGGGILSNGDVDVNSSITGSGILCDTLNAGVSTATDLTVNSLTASNPNGIECVNIVASGDYTGVSITGVQLTSSDGARVEGGLVVLKTANVTGDITSAGSLTGSGGLLTSAPSVMTDLTVNTLTASAGGGIGVSANNVVDIGEDALRFKDIYATGTLDMADGKILIGTGSAATPSIAFSSDTDTGIGLVGGGCSLMAGGLQRFAVFAGSNVSVQDLNPNSNNAYNLGTDALRWKDIYATGTLDMADGTVLVGTGSDTNPTFAFSGDLDTGIRSPTTNTLRFLGGAVPLYDINSSQHYTYVKINPNANNTLDLGEDALRWKDIYATGTLDMADGRILAGTGSATVPSYGFNADANTGIYQPSATSIGLSADGTLALAAFSTAVQFFAASPPQPNASNVVDLGTDAARWRDIYASGTLDMADGKLYLGTGSGGDLAIRFGEGGAADDGIYSSAGNIFIVTDGAARMRFSSNRTTVNSQFQPSSDNTRDLGGLNASSELFNWKNCSVSGSYFVGGAPLQAYGSVVTHDDGSVVTMAAVDATVRPMLTFESVGAQRFMTGSVGASHHGQTVDYNGMYEISFDAQFAGTGNAKVWQFHIYTGPSGSTAFNYNHLCARRTIGTGGDQGSCMCKGIVPLTASDLVEVWVQCTDEQTLSIHSSNLTVRMVDDWPA